jgi:23S rRNA (cytosine1962-C5)-methyltransferase
LSRLWALFYSRRKIRFNMNIFLKPNRERSLLARHPWVYSGAIDEARIKTPPATGSVVTLRTASGGFLAHAGWSAASQLRARVWSFIEGEQVDDALVYSRLEKALKRRETMGFAQREGFRWVHGESDALPGLAVDVYGEVIVFSISAAMMESFREAVVNAILKLRTPAALVERSDADVRALEGLPERNALVHGAIPKPHHLSEHGIVYALDVMTGHKTGYYLDQADNRALTQTLAQGKRVLNCFCYTGGFSLAAVKGGALHVDSVDASAEALALAKQNVGLNDLDAEKFTWAQEDVFSYLRRKRDAAAQYDLIVLDPPKFAPSAALAEKAARAYKDINLWAMKLLAPGGTLMTYSCSGGVDEALFQKIVAGAAVDAKATMRIVRKLSASADHPALLHFPEGHYLKGLVLERCD